MMSAPAIQRDKSAFAESLKPARRMGSAFKSRSSSVGSPKRCWKKLKQRLLKIIDPQTDSLRFYRLPGDREKWVEVYGVDHYVDYDAPMVI
jgi:CRISPR/Cas system-associated endoribonuclease Cas2